MTLFDADAFIEVIAIPEQGVYRWSRSHHPPPSRRS
jgi:hypothetical protein